MKKIYILIFALMVMPLAMSAQVTFNGNGNGGFGEPIGGSNMVWTDDGSKITVTFTKGVGGYSDAMVIYISTGASGRNSVNSDVDDQGDPLRRAISSAGTNASDITLPLGFEATHAIGINTGFGGLWSIPNSGTIVDNDLNFVTGVNSSFISSSASFTFEFTWANLGLSANDPIHFVATYLNAIDGFTSDEGYGSGLPSGNPGGGAITFNSYFEYPSGVEITNTKSVSINNTVGYRLMSAPASTTFGTLLAPVWTQGIPNSDSPSNGTANVWTWNNASTTDDNSNWTAISDMDNSMASGAGFLYYHFNDDNYDGVANASTTSLSVTAAENSAPTVTVNGNTDMYTLVGNPFATAISWNDLGKTNLYASAHVHHPISGWQEVTSGSPLIAPFQAVFVRTAAGSPELTIGTGAKESGGTFVGKINQEKIVSFEAKSGQLSDLNRIIFNDDATIGHDRFDTERLSPLNQQYLMMPMIGENSRTYSTVSFPELSEVTEIPVAIEFTNVADVVLSIQDFNPPAGYTVELLDNLTGSRINVSSDFEYTFSHAQAAKLKSSDEIVADFGVFTSQSEPRFKLIITPPTTTSVVPNDSPSAISLSQNYPNPFNPSTSVQFALPEAGFVSLAVYDVTGRLIASIANGEFGVGEHTVSFDASALSSGVYVYRLNAGGQTLTRKMTLMK